MAPAAVARTPVGGQVDPRTDLPARPSTPPFYSDRDVVVLRARFGLPPLTGELPRAARWKCWVADPSCRFNAELNATSAYAYRIEQTDPSDPKSDTRRWHSARAQYDVWINFVAASEVVGRQRYTTVTLGPKGGVTASDNGDLWGNVGMGSRYWLGRGAWAPSIELSTALSFHLQGRDPLGVLDNARSPLGVTVDVGIGLGGWGAIVLGGQYNAPLARENVPEAVRTTSSGMLFMGFRGNVLWGVPAGAAVAAHALAGRSVDAR
ncbi:MAG: hypothetical protein V3V08_25145 [Nannocystaceae bacterium]